MNNESTTNTQVTFPEFPWNISIQEMPEERFIQECSIMLFGNVDFNNIKIPVETIAKQCVYRSKLLYKCIKDTKDTQEA